MRFEYKFSLFLTVNNIIFDSKKSLETRINTMFSSFFM